jgi:hypothetical protein
METTHVSETSTLYNHTPGNYPKEDNIRFSQHGESLKTRTDYMFGNEVTVGFSLVKT